MKLKCKCERMIPINNHNNMAECTCGLMYRWHRDLWRCVYEAEVVEDEKMHYLDINSTLTSTECIYKINEIIQYLNERCEDE